MAISNDQSYFCLKDDSTSTFAISLITYGIILVAAIFNLIGYYCIIRGPIYDRALKAVLVSSFTANIFGIYSVAHEVLIHKCDKSFDLHLVSASVGFTISHLLLISVAESERVFNRRHKKARNFTSFLVLVWFISPLTAFLVSPTNSNFTRVLTSISQAIFLLFVVQHHGVRVKWDKIYRKQEKIYNDYFLRGKHLLTNNEEQHRYFQRKHIHIILIVEISCMLPWIFFEILEGVNKGFRSSKMQDFATILYSVSFVTQPLLCVFVSYQKNMKRNTGRRLLSAT